VQDHTAVKGDNEVKFFNIYVVTIKISLTFIKTAFMYDPSPLITKGMYLSPTKHERAMTSKLQKQ